MKYIKKTYEKWFKEGKKLFGTDDVQKWKFKCSGCGIVQSCEGLNENFSGLDGYFFATIYLRCIGWIDKEMGCKTAMDLGKGKKSGIRLIVTDKDGKKREVPVFDFARPKDIN